MSSKEFSTLEIDAVGEILNISLGASATALSTLLNVRVDITTPVVKVVEKKKFEFEELEPAVGVEITYVEGLRGSNIMLLKRTDVKMIVEMMMGMEIPDDQFEMNEINISAICEVMNQMMGASSTALSEFLGETVNISTPTSTEIEDVHKFKEHYFADEEVMICVKFLLRIGDNLESEFMNLMPTDLAKKLVKGFLPDFDDDEPEPEPAATPAAEPAPEPAAEESSNRMMSQEEIEALLAGGAGESSEPAAPEPAAEETSNRMMSQEEIEALLAGGGAESSEPAAPAPAAEMPQPAAPAPQAAPAVTPTPQPAPAAMPVQPQEMAAVQQPVMPQAAVPVNNALTEQMMNQMAQMTQMMSQMQQVMMTQMQQRPSADPKKLNVHPMPSDPLSGRLAGEEQEENMDMILGVPLEVSVEIGRTRKLVRDILEFTKGSLVVLDKMAGEQVDLFVNGQCVARGDVVVVEDNFGIRITEILAENMPELK